MRLEAARPDDLLGRWREYAPLARLLRPEADPGKAMALRNHGVGPKAAAAVRALDRRIAAACVEGRRAALPLGAPQNTVGGLHVHAEPVGDSTDRLPVPAAPQALLRVHALSVSHRARTLRAARTLRQAWRRRSPLHQRMHDARSPRARAELNQPAGLVCSCPPVPARARSIPFSATVGRVGPHARLRRWPGLVAAGTPAAYTSFRQRQEALAFAVVPEADTIEWDDAAFDAALKRVAAEGVIDAPGVLLTSDHLRRLLEEAPKDPEHPDRRLVGEANFGGASFSGRAIFSGVTFGGKAIFSRATFGGGANFGGATFGGDVYFVGATFSGDADFRPFGGDAATFGGSANFGEATFGGDVYFRGTFSGNAYFDRATFGGGADFGGTTFTGDALFFQATFSSVAWFLGATFTGYARFNGATFSGDAAVDRETFSRDPYLRAATFSGVALFERATFGGDADFNGATFDGDADFNRATVGGDAGFNRATFGGDADFDVATFSRDADFFDAIFSRDAKFRATFGGDAHFGRASFGGDALFFHATFSGDAVFGGSTFTGYARFIGTTFTGYARFDGATFGGDAHFGRASFGGDADFGRAIFEHAREFGPVFVLGALVLDEVVFAQHVRIEVSARRASLVRAVFRAGADVSVRWAEVSVEDADFAEPSLLAERPAPWWGDTPPLGTPPRVVSLRRAKAARLTLSGVDLRACRFAGAHGLDGLRLERARLAQPPSGWRLRLRRPRWTRRQTVAEEHHWRAEHRHGPGWYEGQGEAPDWLAQASEPPEPEQIAATYRALRKAREDNKDEPGAADFYYGEMEMRRYAAKARRRFRRIPGIEEAVLRLYWLVSGYGLRASRALVALAITIAVGAVLLGLFGFDADKFPEEGALLFAAESSISLLRAPDSDILTDGGTVVQIVLRLAGPLFFGLALLSLRGRVKR
jgi:hypothetical protein